MLNTVPSGIVLGRPRLGDHLDTSVRRSAGARRAGSAVMTYRLSGADRALRERVAVAVGRGGLDHAALRPPELAVDNDLPGSCFVGHDEVGDEAEHVGHERRSPGPSVGEVEGRPDAPSAPGRRIRSPFEAVAPPADGSSAREDRHVRGLGSGGVLGVAHGLDRSGTGSSDGRTGRARVAIRAPWGWSVRFLEPLSAGADGARVRTARPRRRSVRWIATVVPADRRWRQSPPSRRTRPIGRTPHRRCGTKRGPALTAGVVHHHPSSARRHQRPRGRTRAAAAPSATVR